MSDHEEPDSLALAVAERLFDSLEVRPLSTIAGVAGVGFVLAQGIPNFALRIGANIALRATLSQLAQAAARAHTSADPHAPSSSETSRASRKVEDTDHSPNA